MLHHASHLRVLLAVSAVVVAVAMIALAGGAGAAVHGITPLSPVDGATVPKGESPILRMRVKGPGQVWVHVCRSKKRGPAGVICGKLAVGKATRRGDAYEFKPKFYDFPKYWLNRKGTYYWQAFRVACSKRDCRQEGKVVRFRVG
jgi:hypothetical protein